MTSISRAKHAVRMHAHNLHAPWSGSMSMCNCADQDSVMDNSVQGPSATKKQKIEDRWSLRKWSGAAAYKILFSISMSHSFRPPSHSFFGMSHSVACHEVGSSAMC